MSIPLLRILAVESAIRAWEAALLSLRRVHAVLTVISVVCKCY